MKFAFGFAVLAALGYQIFCDVSEIEERGFPSDIDLPSDDGSDFVSSLMPASKHTMSAEFCKRNSEGFYPNIDTNCHSYFICSEEGDPLEMSCPADSTFDHQACTCKGRQKDFRCCQESSSNSSCRAKASLKTDVEEVDNAEEQRSEVCKSLGEGWYPEFSNDCRTFFHCKSRQDWRPVVLPCPTGMQFSSDACSCVTSGPSATCDPTLPIRPCYIPEFDGCKSLPPGAYVSYMSDCERYFMCSPSSMETYFFDCPKEQKFDLVSCTCIPEAGVDCSYCASLKPCIPKTTTTPTTTTTTPTTTTTTPTTTTTTPTTTTTTPTTTTTTPTTTTTTPTTTTTTPTTTTTTPTTTTTTPTTTTLPPTPPPGSCTGKDTGLYPFFDSDCQCYYGCVDGIDYTYSYMCPPFFHFDIYACSCMPAYLVQCQASDEDKGCVPEAPTTVSTMTPPTTPFSDYCNGKGAGYYADINRDCEWYFVCMGGEFPTTQFHCPSDLRFSHYTCQCEYPYQVPCTILDAGPCVPKTTTLAPTIPTKPTPRPDPDHFCEGKLPGFYIDDTQACNFYYLCVPDNPKPYIFQCDADHRFDLEAQECIWKDDYHC